MDAVFAAERLLLLRGVVMLGALSITVSVCLAVLLGAVRPLSRRVFRRMRRMQAENRRLRDILSAQADRILGLEADIVRLKELRKRSDDGCARKHAELEAAREETAALRALLEHLPSVVEKMRA
jgi:septal ring factor EnvC (AmiA/AmiB activator)